MGLFFDSKQRDRTIAIFDIGSGSIGGSFVRIPADKNKIPIILKTVRTDIKDRKSFDFSMFLKDMVSTLSTTANSLYHQKAGVPEEIFCVMASPWYLSETRVIKLSREKPFTFTRRLAGELIQKEVASLTDTYKSKYGNLDSAPELIEQHTMSVSLNGYAIDDPLGKKCTFFEMNMVISLVPKLCLDKMKEALSKTFHGTKVQFSSFTLASYLAVRDKYIIPDSYLLLDVSGEVTDVGIVTKGVLKSVLSFPFGKKTFFKFMCTKLEIELRDAEELFRLYSDNNLHSELKEKVEPLFKSIENSWGEAFKQCISTLPRTLILPDTVFLTADNDIKKWFAEVLRKEDYVKSSGSDSKCTVITLDGPEFLNACGVDGSMCDPFMMIEAIAIMRKINK
jgi:hypothetical protein